MKLTKNNILSVIKEHDIFLYFDCLNMTYPSLKKFYRQNFVESE
jgi:hypothetical protein